MLLFLRKSNLFVSAHPRTIIFGCCENSNVIEKNAFVFDLSLLTNLYESFVKILYALRKDIEQNETVIGSFESNDYVFKTTTNNVVTLINQKSKEPVLTIQLDYFQFNELVYSIYIGILPTLCLQNFEAEFFQFIIESPTKDLITIKSFNNFKAFIKNTEYEKDCSRLFSLYNYYLDIILILTKLRQFCNDAYLPNNVETLLKTV